MPFHKSAANCRTCASNNKSPPFLSPAASWRRRLAGATAIEYALIAAAIALAIMGLVFTIGDDVFKNMYQKLADLLEANLS